MYAMFVNRNRSETSPREIRLELRTVRTGSRPFTSARTLNALFHPTKANCVLTNAVAMAFPLSLVPTQGSVKFAQGSLIGVKPERTARPADMRLGMCYGWVHMT